MHARSGAGPSPALIATYSIHTTWRQTASLANDYCQTFAHISVVFGFLCLLQHLVAWGIDIQVQDDMGLTALHYAYFFQQQESVILRNSICA